MASAAPSTAASKKRLALAIIDFLNTSVTDGTLSRDDAESIEIASNCIAESFSVDPTDTAAMADALGGQNLASIYSVYEKLKGRTTASTESDSSAKEGRPSTPLASSSSDNKKEADRLKGQGNAAMQAKDYHTAIDFYTRALDLVPLNPIFLSNRAAAYSGAGRHADAKADAEMATAADPAYTKAWSRLGLARFALGDAKGSMEAYQQGIEAEGNGGSEAMKKGFETAKRRVEEEGGSGAAARSSSPPSGGAGGMPDLSALAGMLGGGGGQGGQGGGMPDFSALMNNPMLRQMAQSVMSNPSMMQNMLSNPRLREMAEQFGGGGGGGGAGGGEAGAGRGAAGGGGGGGGMPDFSQMMQDPSIMEMARNLMGGGAGGPGGAAGGNNDGGAGRGAGGQ